MTEPPSLPGVTHEWIDAGGLRTHVALAGDEAAPPLLLVHGWPQHWWAWRFVIGEAAKTWRVVAPDLRGYGWTDAPEHGYEKDQFAADVLALLDAMGIDKVTWAGHDWGAFTGYLAAMRAPARFERLVAMCIPPPFARDRSPKTLALLMSYQVPISTPVLGSLLARKGFTARILKAARAQGAWTDEEIAVYDDVFRARPHVSVQTYRTFLTKELLPLAGGKYSESDLTVPTTMLVGDKDRITQSVTAENYPAHDVRRVSGAGHFVPEEAPDAVIAALS